MLGPLSSLVELPALPLVETAEQLSSNIQAWRLPVDLWPQKYTDSRTEQMNSLDVLSSISASALSSFAASAAAAAEEESNRKLAALGASVAMAVLPPLREADLRAPGRTVSGVSGWAGQGNTLGLGRVRRLLMCFRTAAEAVSAETLVQRDLGPSQVSKVITVVRLVAVEKIRSGTHCQGNNQIITK